MASKKQEFDKSMIENINNYSSEIITIHDFMEACRKTIGQYLGSIGNKGFLNMFREIFQNSIDEIDREKSPCNWIGVTFDERTNIVTIRDNGRGIPFERMVDIFSNPHTSSNYEKKKYEYSSGRHGIGSKATNAASEYFIVESHILGEGRRMEFRKGTPYPDEEPTVIKNPTVYQGTIITFKPLDECMGKITVKSSEVYSLVRQIIHLTKIGSVVDFESYSIDGTHFKERVVNEDGLAFFLIEMSDSPLIKPVHMFSDNGDRKAEISFTYDAKDMGGEQVITCSNFCPTITGTHYDGFIDGITKYFRDYMNRVYLGPKSKLTVANVDIKTGLKAIVSVSELYPIFSGQSKDILSNIEMKDFVSSLVVSTLTQWAKSNPNDLQKLCKYFKEVATIRTKSDTDKIKLANNYTKSVFSGMPDKYRKPSGRENLELVLLEGDSALSSTTNSRCHKRQALFPLKGKPPNAFDKSPADFFANETVSSIFTILGCGYGKNFDLKRCIWEKVILFPDADPDGAHIRTLLMMMFIIYAKPLVLDGRLYSANPPLYSLKIKNKNKYFIDDYELAAFIQQDFIKKHELTDINGKPIRGKEMIDLIVNNGNYARTLEVIGVSYAINPHLLEQVVVYMNSDFNTFKKAIESMFRFAKVSDFSSGGHKSWLVSGPVDGLIQTVIVDQVRIQIYNQLSKYIHNAPYQFVLDGKVMTLYGLMTIFEKTKPRVQRYKGIGEMDEAEVGESTLHPDANRTLTRITVEDAAAEIQRLREYNSNKRSILDTIVINNTEDAKYY